MNEQIKIIIAEKGTAVQRNKWYSNWQGWLVDWCLTALSAQKGYIMPGEK